MSETIEELAEVENLNEIVIATFSEFQPKLVEFEKQYAGVVYDLTDPDEEKKARSDKLAVGKIISRLDSAHKIGKAPHKEVCDHYDSARKFLKDGFLSVQGKIKDQLDARDKELAEHAEMLQNMVDALTVTPEMTLQKASITTSEYLRGWIKDIKSRKIDDEYEDRQADATFAKVKSIETLEALLAARIKYEEEQAELNKLRKETDERDRADREKEIRQAAEAKAKQEAEASAKKEIDDAKKKQADAEEARQAAILAQEQSVIRAKEEKEAAIKQAAKDERERIERKQKEDEANAKAKLEKEEASKATQEHRRVIHTRVKESFMEHNVEEEEAIGIVNLLKEGLISNVSINY